MDCGQLNSIMATTSGYVDYAADPMIDYEVQLPEYVLKLRGLPWTCTTKEILEFFSKGTIFVLFIRIYDSTQ